MNSLRAAGFFGALSLAMLTGLSLSACGDDTPSPSGGSSGSGGTGGTGGSDVLGDHGIKYAAAFCGSVFKCCNAADLVEIFGNGLDADSSVVDYAGCRILYRTVWDAAFEPTILDSKKAGRLDFDEAAFNTCLMSIANRTCGDITAASSFCQEVFIPKVKPGDACTSTVECINGKCDIADGAVEGKCVEKAPLAGSGESCASNEECEEKLYCEASKCAAVKADGAACGNNDECQSGSCVGKQQGMGMCGTVCEGGGSGPGEVDSDLETIGASLAGAVCDKIYECCDADERADELLGGINGESECRSFYGAFAGLALVQLHNSKNEGKVKIDGEALEDCIKKYEELSCADYSKGVEIECLNGIEGLVANGKSCSSDSQCTSKYCNEAMAGQGTCAELPGAGAPCVFDCAEGFYCEAQTCTAQKALGDACTSNDQCSASRCFGPMAGAETCSLICDGK